MTTQGREGYRLVKVNGLSFGVVMRNEAVQGRQTLVLLHGFTGNAIGWGQMLDELAHSGWRVIALDLLGHGQSDAPSDPERYTIEHCQEDIIGVLRQLGVHEGEAILLGYSMGGRIALYCAFSGFFRALILESASPGLADVTERERRNASDRQLAASIEQDGVAAFVEHWEHLPLFATQRNMSREQQAALHAQRLNNRASGLANSLRGVGTGVQPALHNHLPNLNIPVLLIAGQLDPKFCTIAQQMAQALPQAQLQIVPSAGHTVHLEQPETFLALVTKFCRQSW